MTLADRFRDKVALIPEHGCWEWTGVVGDNGYGRIRGYSVSWLTAHRLSWMLYRGPIPPGLCVLHRCDNRTCVNPQHLFLGTRTDNAADRDRKGRLKDKVCLRLDRTRAEQIRARPHDRAVELAKEFGVTRYTIYKIRQGLIWKPAPEKELHHADRRRIADHP